MKKLPQKIKIDFGTVLLLTGALANVPLWIGAFASTGSKGAVGMWLRDVALPVTGSIAGLAMAFTMAFGLVYVLGRLAKMQPTYERKTRGKDEYKTHPNMKFYTTLVAMILLLVISLALLSPLEFVDVAGEDSLYSALGSSTAGWWWSVGRVAAADLALAAIALVHGVPLGAGAQPTSKPQSDGSNSVSGGSAKKKKRSANGSGSSAVFPCPHTSAGCKVVKPTQGAINAHAGKCKFKIVALDKSLLIDQSKADKS